MAEIAPEISCATFTHQHLDGLVRLCEQVNWPHRRVDLKLITDLSDGVVLLREKVVLGTGFCTSYGPDLCASNLIMMDQTMRSRGLGRRVMAEVLRYAGNRENRLVATAQGLPLYEKMGFIATGKIAQLQGIAAPNAQNGGAVWDDTPDMNALIALEAQAFGGDRSAAIRAVAGIGRVATISHAGRVEGFAILRPFGRGQLIGPVVASDTYDAKSLISFMLSACQGSFVRIDVPEDMGLVDWLETQGLIMVGGGVAMSSRPGAVAGTGPARTFGLINQAMG